MLIRDAFAEVVTEAPGAAERDWKVDGGLTLVFMIFTVLPHLVMLAAGLDYGLHYGNNLLVFVTAWFFILPLILRRHYPLLMVVLAGIVGVLQVVVCPMPPMTVIAVPFMAYSVARWVEDDMAHLVIWLGMLGSILGPMRWLLFGPDQAPNEMPGLSPPSSPSVGLLMLATAVCMGGVITPYAVGRRIRENALFVEEQTLREEERKHAVQAQLEQRARIAEFDTRHRIAQELHDIVAHSLSVMIVQAEGGKALAAKKPEAAAEVLGTIADTGREALVEMRRIVSVLRADLASNAEYGPAPSLADIPDMVAKTGEHATLTVVGHAPPVSPALGLTVYRVVQEALTNVLKHAGEHATARVMLTYSPTSIQVEVRDDGVGAAAASDGQGNGLRGMRERVSSMGGRLQAEALPEGGFLVWVLLPLGSGPRPVKGVPA